MLGIYYCSIVNPKLFIPVPVPTLEKCRGRFPFQNSSFLRTGSGCRIVIRCKGPQKLTKSYFMFYELEVHSVPVWLEDAPRAWMSSYRSKKKECFFLNKFLLFYFWSSTTWAWILVWIQDPGSTKAFFIWIPVIRILNARSYVHWATDFVFYVVDPDPDSMGSLPGSVSGFGSRRAKMTHKHRKKVNKFNFLKCSMFTFEGWRFLLLLGHK